MDAIVIGVKKTRSYACSLSETAPLSAVLSSYACLLRIERTTPDWQR